MSTFCKLYLEVCLTCIILVRVLRWLRFASYIILMYRCWSSSILSTWLSSVSRMYNSPFPSFKTCWYGTVAPQVMGYKGPAVVVVSCVTVDPPYRPHPHNLVGKEGCKKGVCTMTINNDSMQCVFSNLGIQCVKKRDVEDALKLREEIRVDPFQSKCVLAQVSLYVCLENHVSCSSIASLSVCASHSIF